jgi:hypothetical protein
MARHLSMAWCVSSLLSIHFMLWGVMHDEREEKQMSNTHASRSRGVQFGVKITDIERGVEGRGEAYQCKTSSRVELSRSAVFGRLPGGQQSHPPVGPQLRPRRSLGERTRQQDGRAAAPWAWEGLGKLGSCGSVLGALRVGVPFSWQVASARGLGRSDRGGRRLLIEFSYSSFGPVNRKCVCSGREGCAGLHACARSRSLVGSVGGVR